jgi:hypothetical protein
MRIFLVTYLHLITSFEKANWWIYRQVEKHSWIHTKWLDKCYLYISQIREKKTIFVILRTKFLNYFYQVFNCWICKTWVFYLNRQTLGGWLGRPFLFLQALLTVLFMEMKSYVIISIWRYSRVSSAEKYMSLSVFLKSRVLVLFYSLKLRYLLIHMYTLHGRSCFSL